MSDCRLRDALEARFTDESEVRDVARYGCISGVSDFIYYHETIAFFDKHQSDIENWLFNDHDWTLEKLCKNAEDVDQLKMKWSGLLLTFTVKSALSTTKPWSPLNCGLFLVIYYRTNKCERLKHRQFKPSEIFSGWLSFPDAIGIRGTWTFHSRTTP